MLKIRMQGTVTRVSLLYGGRSILLWLCKIFLGGNQDPLSGILFLCGYGGFIC